MEALKFAFDTLIIGALALPWLWLFMRIFFQRGATKHDKITFPLIDLLSPSTQEYVGLALIIGIGYFLGCAVSRISSDFFDDDEILLGMPNHVSIQKGVYLHEYCDPHSVLVETQVLPLPVEIHGGKADFCNEFEKDGSKEKDEVLEQAITEVFRLQESKLLLEGEEKLGRVREFHDQIEILRGAALNTAMLFALSCFGLCKLYRTRKPADLPVQGAQNESLPNAKNPPQITFFAKLKNFFAQKISPSKLRILLTCVSYAPAVACLALGVWAMTQHYVRQYRADNYLSQHKTETTPPRNPYEAQKDPPLAESLLILLGVGGLLVPLADDNPRLFRNVCLMAGVLTLIAYGSWWWTEVLYDQQVIHSLTVQYNKINSNSGK